MMNLICFIYYLVHKLTVGIYLKSTNIKIYIFKTVLENHTEGISKYPRILYMSASQIAPYSLFGALLLTWVVRCGGRVSFLGCKSIKDCLWDTFWGLRVLSGERLGIYHLRCNFHVPFSDKFKLKVKPWQCRTACFCIENNSFYVEELINLTNLLGLRISDVASGLETAIDPVLLSIFTDLEREENILNKNINSICKVLVSWGEIKDPSNFSCVQKAYFSQMLFTNLFTSLLVIISPLPR